MAKPSVLMTYLDRASSVAFIKASQAANAIGVGLGTSPGESAGGAGKGSVAISTVATSVDPSRMGIWLCLLDGESGARKPRERAG